MREHYSDLLTALDGFGVCTIEPVGDVPFPNDDVATFKVKMAMKRSALRMSVSGFEKGTMYVLFVPEFANCPDPNVPI